MSLAAKAEMFPELVPKPQPEARLLELQRRPWVKCWTHRWRTLKGMGTRRSTINFPEELGMGPNRMLKLKSCRRTSKRFLSAYLLWVSTP